MEDLKEDLDKLKKDIRNFVNKYDVTDINISIDKLYKDSMVTLRIDRR